MFQYVQYFCILSVCAAWNDISNVQTIISLSKLHDYQRNLSDLDGEYSLCIKMTQERSNTPESIFGPFYKFSMEHESVRFPCSPCRYSTYPFPTWIKLSFENEKTQVNPSDKYQIEDDDSLIINSVSKVDFGTYYCIVNGHVGYIWSLESESYEHLKTVSAKIWDSNKDSQEVHFQNMRINIEWRPWEPCNKCDYVGKSHRIGYCSIQKSTNTTTSYEALDAYPSGLSCNLFFLIHPDQEVDVIRSLMRGPFIMMKFCKISCGDIDFDPQTRFKNLDSQIHDFYKKDLKALIEGEQLNSQYDSRLHRKFHVFSLIPTRKPTAFEWFLLISLFLLQVYIFVHVCKNRSRAR